ncbi:hypothetical protein BSPWISOXPB_3656 [uncultured Gammaproteobacteria bacterium]|nr:hypothetical protein BSPWISOXPB_3656 [uncultured Gammaproteobacteria bacterium]
MSWQTILISNPCKLSIKNNNILLRRLDEEDVIVVISEVSAVVLRTHKLL